LVGHSRGRQDWWDIPTFAEQDIDGVALGLSHHRANERYAAFVRMKRNVLD